MVETTTEKTSEATVAANETIGVPTIYVETFMKCKLMIIYRASSKKRAATTAMMIMLTTENLIGWCLKKLLNECNYCCV